MNVISPIDSCMSNVSILHPAVYAPRDGDVEDTQSHVAGGHICNAPPPILVYRLIGIFKRFAALVWQMAFGFIIVHGY